MPYLWLCPFAIRQALYLSTDPLGLSLVLNNHRDPTTFIPLVRATNFQVLFCSIAVSSSFMATTHFGRVKASWIVIGSVTASMVATNKEWFAFHFERVTVGWALMASTELTTFELVVSITWGSIVASTDKTWDSGWVAWTELQYDQVIRPELVGQVQWANWAWPNWSGGRTGVAGWVPQAEHGPRCHLSGSVDLENPLCCRLVNGWLRMILSF